MTRAHFSEEDAELKARHLKQHGVYIDSYFLNDHLINVYTLNDFFVEVIINVRKSLVVDYIVFEKGFSGLRRLPYGLGVRKEMDGS